MTYDEILKQSTPRPWPELFVEFPSARRFCDGVPEKQLRADEDLIVLAVNSHEALVRALEMLRLQVLQSDLMTEEEWVLEAMDAGDAALALARGEK